MGTVTITENVDDLEYYQNLNDNMPRLYVTLELDEVTTDITEYLIKVPIIDRQKQILPENISELKSDTAVFTVANTGYIFSPKNENSLFFGKEYLSAVKITVYSGFITDSSTGDALVTSQLVCYLYELTLDTNDNTAQLLCYGTTKLIERKKVGVPLSDGTPDPLVYSGTQSFKTIVESLLGTHGGLSSGQYSIQDVGTTFTDIEFTNLNITSAIAYLAQVAGCELYEDRFGRITAYRFEPSPAGLITLTVTDENYILRLKSSESLEDLAYTVSITGYGDIYSTGTESANIYGRIISLSNNYIQSQAAADDLVSQYFDRYGSTSAMLQLDLDFYPSLDINDIVLVSETQSGISESEYEIYRIILDLENFKSIIYLVPSSYGFQVGFLASRTTEISDPEAPEATYYDDADQRDKQFLYLGDRDDTSETPPKYLLTRR